jgi:hypothetical protein
VNASWSAFSGATTNWDLTSSSTSNAGFNPGALNTVNFSNSAAAFTSGTTIATTLDNAYAVNALKFAGAPTGVSVVTIASGVGGAASNLTIAPSLATDGISVGANAGAVTVLDGGQLADPKWQTRVTYSWQQRLGPGLTDLNLAYKPIAGSQWGGGFFKQQEWERTYCLDVRRLPAGMKTETGDVQVDTAVPVHLMLARDVAALGPVGDLRVVVEPTPRVGWMERAQHLAACLQQGMRRVGPTRMELRRRNVSRVEDLQVLFMGTLPP